MDNFQPSRAVDLRHELSMQSRNHNKKKAALRKIVANMSLNSVEMLNLFPDVVNCLQMDDIEVKRLSTLYLETYAKARVDIAVTALPFLVKDSRSSDPLVRSLALRTVSAIPITAFVNESIKLCSLLAKDEDPLVRVAATYAMAKVWAHQPRAAENEGFLGILNKMLNDRHPRVSATAVSCLLEIASATPSMTITIDQKTATYLCQSLDKCNEWCQAYILRILQYYVPQTEAQAFEILRNTYTRVQHANTAVVIASMRLSVYLLNFMHDLDIPGFQKSFLNAFSMSKPPQLQYILLRNLCILLQSHTRLVASVPCSNFFSRYNDPTYLRTAKIQVLEGLANPSNAEEIISELCMCAADVDVEASRKAISVLAKLAVKLPAYSELCLQRLLRTLESGAPYIVQEVAIALRLISRKFPSYDYGEFIAVLCDSLDDVFDDLDAKVALLSVLGDYPAHQQLKEILTDLLLTLPDEDPRVQLVALTTATKLFFTHPQSTTDIIPKIYQEAAALPDPDTRDRAIFYWRLVSHDPRAACDVVVAQNSDIELEGDLDDATLEELDHSLGYLSSLYLKSPSKMFRVLRPYHLPQSPALVPRSMWRETAPSAPQPSVAPARQRPTAPPSRLDRTHSVLLHRPTSLRQPTTGSHVSHASRTTPIPESPETGSSPFVDPGEKLIDI